jgi:diguanylate cyclase (GGDEF)-like protein
VLLDIDDFKLVNDTLGHPTGDAVIASIAGLLREQVRETDVLARLGGDELAVLLPRADREQARLVAGKLVETVRSHKATFRGADLRVTASIGLALITEPGTQTAEDLMVEADIAVYEAKSAGRDRFRIFEGPRGKIPEVERAASRG